MNTRNRLSIFGIAASLSLLAGSPTLADDTELLLLNPGDPPNPNILFILDSSGSMGDNENTREVYVSTDSYSGDCDEDYYYWTETNAVPVCDGSNTRKFLKTAYKCEASDRLLTGIGSYTDTMAQYRDGGSGFFSIFLGLDAFRWQQLEAGNESDIVECENDSGLHGDNSSSTAVYAQRGGDDEGDAQYTTDPDEEVSWGSWPVAQNVTIYDGNYLNYRANPTTVSLKKIDIMKTVMKTVLSSVDDVNVGIMRFNDEEGGPVIQAVEDLEANRTAITSAIDSITADGYTPLAETLYESARYWRGIAADYGENINDWTTDPAALSSAPGDPEVYLQPAMEVCTKNYNVLLTDGVPVRDQGAPGKAPNLPEWQTITGTTACEGTGQGHCLDDIAKYLYEGDIKSTLNGPQTVTTHTIGFAIDLPILEDAAEASNGEYFRADDIEQLTLALLKIVSTITDKSLSFSAPAVAVNSFNRTRNLNDLYLTTFAARENMHWSGNLKKYRISEGAIVDSTGALAVDPGNGFFKETARSYWSTEDDGNDVKKGGAANQLPDPSVRKVYTNITASNDLTTTANHLSVANMDTFTLADLGLTGSSQEPTKEQLIDWARGVDVTDENPEGDVRYVMGDPLHSQPAAVVYGGDPTDPDVVVFTATNDGYVHAIDGDTGEELWAFIPKEHLPNLSKLFFDPAAQYKNYGVDGDIVPVVKDVDNDGVIESGDGDFVYIIFGMRRGGSSYYALDVTNKTSPSIKWRVSDTGFGQSWSTPTVAKIDIDKTGFNSDKAVVIIGGGYDTVHDTLAHPSTADTNGAGVYFLDLQNGEVVWRAGSDGAANTTVAKMTRSIPTQIRVVDVSGDGFADRMYAADMGGQVLRFDIFNGEVPDDLVTGGVIARLGAEGKTSPTDADTRRFYGAPDVSIFNDTLQNRRFIAISLGSGYRAHPLDNTPAERFYSLRDPDIFNALTQNDYDTYDIIEEDTLVEVAGTARATVGSSKDGWMFTLPATQKVLTSSVTFNNEIFFVAFSPDNAASASCAAGLGRNFLYRVSVTNGDPIVDNIDTLAVTQADAERVTDLAQGGIAPSPQFLFPSAEADCDSEATCNPPPLGCVGVECFDPGFENKPVRTLWTQDGIE